MQGDAVGAQDRLARAPLGQRGHAPAAGGAGYRVAQRREPPRPHDVYGARAAGDGLARRARRARGNRTLLLCPPVPAGTAVGSGAAAPPRCPRRHRRRHLRRRRRQDDHVPPRTPHRRLRPAAVGDAALPRHTAPTRAPAIRAHHAGHSGTRRPARTGWARGRRTGPGRAHPRRRAADPGPVRRVAAGRAGLLHTALPRRARPIRHVQLLAPGRPARRVPAAGSEHPPRPATVHPLRQPIRRRRRRPGVRLPRPARHRRLRPAAAADHAASRRGGPPAVRAPLAAHPRLDPLPATLRRAVATFSTPSTPST